MRATNIKRRSMPKWTRVVVQKYTADELAEDSGNEKRLEKAERAAELKAAKRRKKKASSAQSSRSRSLSVRMPGAAVQPASPALPYSELGYEAFHQHDGADTRAPTPVRRAVGHCDARGEMGHMRMSCPRVAAPDRSRKWYPLQMGDVVHESGVDSRPPERSVCDLDAVVCENLSGDVAPRREG